MTESIDATCDVMEAGMEGEMAGVLGSDSRHCFFHLKICNAPLQWRGRGLGSGPKSLEVSHVEQTGVTFMSPSSWVKRYSLDYRPIEVCGCCVRVGILMRVYAGSREIGLAGVELSPASGRAETRVSVPQHARWDLVLMRLLRIAALTLAV